MRKEVIWGNRHIKNRGKSLLYETWIRDKLITIDDIRDNLGKINEMHILNLLSMKQNWITEFTLLKK